MDTSELPPEVIEAFAESLFKSNVTKPAVVKPTPTMVTVDLRGVLGPLAAAALLIAADRLEANCPDRNGAFDLCHCEVAPILREWAAECSEAGDR